MDTNPAMDALIETIATDLLETCEKKDDKRPGKYSRYLPLAIETVRAALVPVIERHFVQIPERFPGYKGDNLRNVATFEITVAVPWRKGLPCSWNGILSGWDSHLIEKPFYYGVAVCVDTGRWAKDLNEFVQTHGLARTQGVLSVEGPAAHDLFMAIAKASRKAS